MALLDKNGNYIRVTGSGANRNYINCCVYPNMNSRKEEIRKTAEIRNFYNRCKSAIDTEYTNKSEETDKIELLEIISELDDLVHSILTDNFSIDKNNIKFIEFYKAHGFDCNWLDNPVKQPSLLRYYISSNNNISSIKDCYRQLKTMLKKEEYKDC